MKIHRRTGFNVNQKQEAALWVLGVLYVVGLFQYRGYAEWYWIHLARTTLVLAVVTGLVLMALRDRR